MINQLATSGARFIAPGFPLMEIKTDNVTKYSKMSIDELIGLIWISKFQEVY